MSNLGRFVELWEIFYILPIRLTQRSLASSKVSLYLLYQYVSKFIEV